MQASSNRALAIIDTGGRDTRVGEIWVQYLGRMFCGVQDTASRLGYACTYLVEGQWKSGIDPGGFVGALGLTNERLPDQWGFWEAWRLKRPCVFLGSGASECNVEADHGSAMARVASHLLEQGCKRPGFFHAGEQPSTVGLKRMGSFRDGLRAHGLELAEPLGRNWTQPGCMEEPLRGEIYGRYLDEARPDAIAFSSDTLALDFAAWAGSRGLSIPRDFAIVGFDDWSGRDWLTSVQNDFYRVGASAVWALHEVLEGSRPASFKSLHIPAPLQVRASSQRSASKPSLGEERVFREAVSQSVRERLASPDLATLLASRLLISRPYFLKKFRRLYSQDFNEWLFGERLSEAAWHLAHTHRPITEIWIEVGFRSAQHFNQLFQRRHGVSPTRYREEKGDVGDPDRGKT